MYYIKDNRLNPNPITKFYVVVLLGVTVLNSINHYLEWAVVIVISAMYFINGFKKDAIKNILWFGMLFFVPDFSALEKFPIFMMVEGHTYILILHAFVVILIAELIRRAGNYNSFKYNMLSFAIFNTWICGSLMQMLWAREKYIEMTMMMGNEYVEALERLVTYPHMALVYIGAILGGLIGANIGRILLKKHFIKAGIV